MKGVSNSDLAVSIIIINYKTAELVKNCIESVIEKSENFSYEVIVIDNSNDDSEFNKLKANLADKNITIINANDNLGFGRANNKAAKLAKGKYVFFLNSDTLLINNAIFSLYEYLENNNKFGIAGGNLYSTDLIPANSFGVDGNNLKNRKKRTGIKALFNRFFRKKRIDFNYSDEPIEVESICGADLMISKELFEKVGGFDENIFMYGEDDVLSYDVKAKTGKLTCCVPYAKIIHLENGSDKEKSDFFVKNFVDGTYYRWKKICGEKVALQYLKFLLSNSRKKYFFAKLTSNHPLKSTQKKFIDYTHKKIKETKN